MKRTLCVCLFVLLFYYSPSHDNRKYSLASNDQLFWEVLEWQTDRLVNRQTARHVYWRTDRHRHWLTDIQTDWKIYRKTNKLIYVQTDLQINRQTDEQTDRYTEKFTDRYTETDTLTDIQPGSMTDWLNNLGIYRQIDCHTDVYTDRLTRATQERVVVVMDGDPPAWMKRLPPNQDLPPIQIYLSLPAWMILPPLLVKNC